MIITGNSNRRSYNCYSGNVCYLLERKGTFLSEHMSFGLSGGLSFQFIISDKIEFRAVRELHCLTEYIYSLGVCVSENVHKCFSDYMQQVRTMVERDLPLMFEYDGFYLPFTQIYNKKHEKRIALIIGYDDRNVYVSDFIYAAYNVPIDFGTLQHAIDKSYGSCVNLTYYEVSFPSDINNKVKEDDIWKVINSVCEHFLLEIENDHQKMIGINGIHTFSKNFDTIIESVDKQELAVNWLQFSEDIKQAVITLRHYGLFLKDIVLNGLVENSACEQILKCAELLENASDNWQIVCRLFFKLGIGKNENLQERIKTNMEKTADILEKAFVNLYRVSRDKI